MLHKVLSDYAFVNPHVSVAGLPENLEVSFIPMQDVSEGGEWINRSTARLERVRSGFTRFQNSDVLVAKITPCFENGKGTLINKTENGLGFGSTEFHILRPLNEDVDPRFIYYVSQDISFRIMGETKMVGSAGQRRVPTKFFYEYELPTFDLNQQSQISDILDAISYTIRKTEELIAKYEQIKQGMMHDLFTQGVDGNGKLRPSYEDAPELYHETELGAVPKEWDVKCMGDITLKVTDRDHYTPFYADEGVPIISPKDFGEYECISFEKCKFITQKEHERNRKKTDLETGDIVFTRIGAGLGKAAIVTEDMPEFSILHSACMIRTDNNFYIPEYLLYFLKYDLLQRQIKREVQSIGVPDLGLDKIKGFLVLRPPKTEQEVIAKRMNAIENKIFSEFKYLQNLYQQKAGLMQDLLTGKVQVNVEKKEAA